MIGMFLRAPLEILVVLMLVCANAWLQSQDAGAGTNGPFPYPYGQSPTFRYLGTVVVLHFTVAIDHSGPALVPVGRSALWGGLTRAD